MSEGHENRIQDLEEDMANVKALLYGDPSKADPGGLRSLVNEAVVVARRTEDQRAKDRQREERFEDEVKQSLEKINKKNVVADATTKSRWTLVKEMSAILLLIAAAITLLTDKLPKLVHMLGF